MQFTYRLRLFLILWLLGFSGILSFLLLDLSVILDALPMTPEERAGLPNQTVLKILGLIQPTILMTLAVVAGVLLANRVGLHAPAAEAAALGKDILSKLKPQIIPGVLGGAAAGVGLVLVWVATKPFLSGEFISQAETFNNVLPAAMRFLFGGFTEELLLRWGLMSFLIWAASRLLKRGDDEPKAVYVIATILFSAMLFGVGHLPVASILNGGALTAPIVIYVITANSLFGIVAGFLYWRRGLESAMLAHISAHVILLAAISLGV
jgi:Type II CAAX prenyl endopeptidase Rce1-like